MIPNDNKTNSGLVSCHASYDAIRAPQAFQGKACTKSRRLEATQPGNACGAPAGQGDKRPLCTDAPVSRRAGARERPSAGQAEPHGGFREAEEALRVKPSPVFRSLELALPVRHSRALQLAASRLADSGI
jgi:hypothetical protein